MTAADGAEATRPAPAEAPGLVAVMAREVRWIAADRLALLLVLAIPLIAFALLAATFGHAVVRGLRVDVVDADRTPTSMTFVHAIQAAPGTEVAQRSGDLNAAMHAVRSGAVIAAVYIPEDFERDLLAGRRPQVVIFSNKQYFSPGNIAQGALTAAANAAAATLVPAAAKTAGRPGPLVVEQYVLTNPALNYVQFLLRAVLPTVLHVLIAISGGYAVGSEFAARGMKSWLQAAGGSALTALVGKLAPYFGIYLVMLAVGVGIIHGLYGVPFRGSPLVIAVAACLFVMAYLCLAALLQLLTKSLPVGLSLTGIFCSPAFGFAGVGFPIIGMNAFAQGWGLLLPLRWYIQILFDEGARGVPVADTAVPMLALGMLALASFGLALMRLLALVSLPMDAPRPEVRSEPAAPRSVVGAFRNEYARVLGDTGLFSLIVAAPILYGVFYPQPYLGQLVRDIPIAVVDDDHTDVSRTLIETLNADEAITVAVQAPTLADARAALQRREVFGIVGIPEDTAREVLKGNEARVPAFVDSAYFLLYNRTLQGISEAAAQVTADTASGGARADGSQTRSARAAGSPVEVLVEPLFNPTGGYGSYVVPAAFVLILQQTLLMGAATAGGVAFERGGVAARRHRTGARALLGQALAHLCLALPAVALYLVVLPRVFGFSASPHLLDLLAFALPFLLAVSFMGQFLGAFFRRRETAMLLIIALSLPMFFLVGVAWPIEAIPEALRRASALFPSSFGIDGLVRLNQMGATLGDVRADWVGMWGLALAYAALAVGAGRLFRGERAQ